MENKISDLINAIIDNNLDKVKELVNFGIDVNQLDKSNLKGRHNENITRKIYWAPIDLAFSLKRYEIANFLKEKGAIPGQTLINEKEGEDNWILRYVGDDLERLINPNKIILEVTPEQFKRMKFFDII